MKKIFFCLCFLFALDSAILAQPQLNFEIKEILPNAEKIEIFQKFELTISFKGKVEKPFDPEVIDLNVFFISPTNKTYIIPAFYYQAFTRCKYKNLFIEQLNKIDEPVWKARFAPTEVGRWKFQIVLSDTNGVKKFPLKHFTCTPSKNKNPGFIRIKKKLYFGFDNGKTFFPIGENLSWFDKGKTYNYDLWLEQLKENKVNFIRIWMAPWSFALEWKNLGLGIYNLEEAWRLDYVLEQCEVRGIYIILVFLDHGQFSSSQNPQWHNNPYNIKNGGPCRTPNDFLKNDIAKKFFKRRIKYILSRWGYSPNIAAWEFFNEVDLSDLNIADLPNWIEEMTGYIKKYDPYDHLITISFHSESPSNIYEMPEISFSQIHIYDKRDFKKIFGSRLIKEMIDRFDKPFIVGEFGWINEFVRTIDKKGIHLHEALWSSALSLSAGSAMIWYWDIYVDTNQLYYHFKPLADFLEKEDLADGFVRFEPKKWDSENFWTIGLRNKNRVLLWISNEGCDFGQYFAYLAEVAKNRIRAERDIPKKAIDFPPCIIKDKRVILEKMGHGRYEVEFWDTYTGKITSKDIVSTSSGNIVLNIPTFSRDIACKIKKIPWWNIFYKN